MKHPYLIVCSFLISTLMVIAACGSVPQSTLPSASLPPATHLPTASTQSPSALQQALAGKYKSMIVRVGAEWMDSDYMTSLREFERQTGINIQYSTISNEFDPDLISEINAGKGLDVEEFTSLVALRSWAQQGKLVDIRTFVDMNTLQERYDQDVLDWATVEGPDGPIMAGVWSMSFTAGVVWYPKAAFDKAGYQVPTTWSALLELSDRIVKDGGTPWCIENGDEGEQGASAAEWISDIMLRTAPPADYDAWVNGTLKFDSPQVKHAAQLMSEIWFKPGYTDVKRQNMNTTYSWDVMPRMMKNPPTCWLFKAPSYIGGWDGQSIDTAFTNKEFGKDYAFFVLPPIEQAYAAPVTLWGHITGMFNDRPEVRALMEYLTTGEHLKAWITQVNRFGFSLHKSAKLEWYPQAGGERASAETVQKASSRRFTALMWMPRTVGNTFCQTISAYVAGDIDLDSALKKIDAQVAATSSTPVSPTTP